MACGNEQHPVLVVDAFSFYKNLGDKDKDIIAATSIGHKGMGGLLNHVMGKRILSFGLGRKEETLCSGFIHEFDSAGIVKVAAVGNQNCMKSSCLDDLLGIRH